MTLEIADDFLNKLEIPENLQIEALKKAKEGYVMALLEAGQISSGRASIILKVSRLEVLEMMGKRGISVFDDSQDLEELSQEVEQAQWLLAQQNS
jgi:predicted HTH domain antitoxin